MDMTTKVMTRDTTKDITRGKFHFSTNLIFQIIIFKIVTRVIQKDLKDTIRDIQKAQVAQKSKKKLIIYLKNI